MQTGINLHAEPQLTLSPTAVTDYQLCPRLFASKYVLRLPQTDATESEAMLVGNFVHKQLEELHSHPELHDVEAASGQEAGVRRYIDAHRQLCPGGSADYLGGELELLAFIRDERILLAGTVDAVWQHTDGTIEVRDYKTGHQRQTPAGDLRAQLYALLAHSRWPDRLAVITYERLGLDQPDTQSLNADASYLEAALRTVSALAEELRDRDSWDATPGQHCQGCVYRSICPDAW